MRVTQKGATSPSGGRLLKLLASPKSVDYFPPIPFFSSFFFV